MSRPESAEAERFAHIVFSTHWDREWIQSFEQYRFRLVNLVDNLIAILIREPELCFVFDGQAIVLEDYLRVRPERRGELAALSNAGRLIFGPWYVLADQFLEGDEAAVRNLLLGFSISREFGGPMLEGYVPDSFGCIAALPAILNGFGIRHANFGRGLAHTKDRAQLLLNWEWKDGSRVFAVAAGYGNAIGLAYPDIWGDVTVPPSPASAEKAFAKCMSEDLPQRFAGAHRYLSVGIDHMELRPEMGAIVRHLADFIPNTRVIVSTPLQFLAAAEEDCNRRQIALETVCGEMRGDAVTPMFLQGVLSTDVPLKQINRRLEILLSRVLEPLSVVHERRTGRSDRHLLEFAWKMLLSAHPHDSICACSTDSTMRDVHVRMAQTEEMFQILGERMLRDIIEEPGAGEQGDPAVLLFNSIPDRGVSSFGGIARLPKRLALGDYRLIDTSGRAVGRARVLAHRSKELSTYYATLPDLLSSYRAEPNPRCEFNQQAIDQPDGTRVRPDEAVFSMVQIDGVLDFGNAIGWVPLRLIHAGSPPPAPPTAGRFVESDRLRVELNADGSLLLVDKLTGRRWRQLLFFEDQADAGHLYDYVPLAGDRPVSSLDTSEVELLGSEGGFGASRMQFNLRWPIPVDLEAGGARQRPASSGDEAKAVSGRRSSRTTAIKISVSCTLASGADRLDIGVRFENTAIQHRLRLALKLDGYHPVISGCHFSAQPRVWQDGASFFTTFPFTDYIHLGDEKDAGGLAFMAKGLHEAEIRFAAGKHDLLVTLCRSVDTISGANSGLNYDVEHGKLLAPLSFELALSPSSSLVETARKAMAFTTPTLVSGALLSGDSIPAAPPIKSFSSASTLFSCLKPAASGAGFVVRCFNLMGKPDQAVIECNGEPGPVRRVELSESDSSKTQPVVVGQKVIQPVGPHEIVTMRFGGG